MSEGASWPHAPLTDDEARAKGWPDAETAMEAVAIHEAGHALSFLLGGASVREVIVRPDATGHAIAKRQDKVRAQDFLAGSVAESLFGLHDRSLQDGDLDELARWEELHGVKVDPEEVLRAALGELQTPEAMAQIRAIADALLDHGRLTGLQANIIRKGATDG